MLSGQRSGRSSNGRTNLLSRIMPICAVLVAGAAMAACGGSGDESSASSTTKSAAETSTAETQIEQQVAQDYKGDYQSPPTTGPKPQPGKNIWIISCGQAVPACSEPSNAEKQAAELVGWKATIFDAKVNPGQYSSGIRQAVAAKADGILLNAIDCPFVKATLQSVRKTHPNLPIVGAHTLDCSDLDPTIQPLLTAQIKYHAGGKGFVQYVEAWARARARWLIAATGDKAKIIYFKIPFSNLGKIVERAFLSELKTCSGCEVLETVDVAPDKFGPPLQAMAQQALLKNPNANAVFAQIDSLITAGVAQAIKASGRRQKLKVMGGEGSQANLAMIAADGGPQDAAVVIDTQWVGWAGVDTMIRVLAEQAPADSGLGLQTVDRDHNITPAGTWKPPVDFKAAYRSAWGVAG